MAKSTCSILDCDKPTVARGWCTRHYEKWRKFGDPTHVTARDKTPEQRFWEKVRSAGEGCWEWCAGLDWDGYGIFTVKRTTHRAHRYAYESLRGAIPDGLHLDHLCRNRKCVNPDHLEPVTPRVNALRGETRAAKNADKSHCDNGHPLDESRKCSSCAVHYTRVHAGWGEERAWSAPIAKASADRVECPQGHPYSPENTYLEKGRSTKRHCRTCHRERQRAYYQAKKEIKNEASA